MTRSSTNISPGELVEMFFKMVELPDSPKSFASLRYIKGMPEPLTRALSKQTIATPQGRFPASKFRPSLDSQDQTSYKKFLVSNIRGATLEKRQSFLN